MLGVSPLFSAISVIIVSDNTITVIIVPYPCKSLILLGFIRYDKYIIGGDTRDTPPHTIGYMQCR